MVNSFERHGLDHLSASSCNLFAAQPALWVAEKILDRRSPVGAAAHRGTAVEAGVALGLLDPSVTVDDCVNHAEATFRQKTALSGDSKRDSESKSIADLTRIALTELCAYGPGALCQERIEWKADGLSVPFIG